MAKTVSLEVKLRILASSNGSSQVKALDSTEFVFQVLSSGWVQVHLVEFKPKSPESTVDPRNVTLLQPTNGIDLTDGSGLSLDTKVNNGQDTSVWVKQFFSVVNSRVVQWDHGKRVGEGDKIDFLVWQFKITGITTDNSDVGPAVLGDSFLGNFT
ncbi:hypothetical protein WICPIJ_001214 [Wickerhamomyces pijperi]|uniref:Uncharacterized protein n=1 Tax=Wickerhamomyces pijperi TaxID=599730 RepID=A0A9P8QC65_WICPI|nr:hypothetical protein WICPIJ_001214 [Wickerhamomyces pijperi]